MAQKRVFILGAGFSRPAGMPTAKELLPLLCRRLDIFAPDTDEMRTWVESLCTRLQRLSGEKKDDTYTPNIEQFFHYAYFDIEVHRLKQHLAPVGRHDGPGTPWNAAESVERWLFLLEDALVNVIYERTTKANLTPLESWARAVTHHDAIITFNYDLLAERALEAVGQSWNHGIERQDKTGIPVYKMHGSIDWIVAPRSESFSKLDLIFEKTNANRSDGDTGCVEDDYRLWRFRTPEQLKQWIEDWETQYVSRKAGSLEKGIAGLGAYKELHRVPGLGLVWALGMRALYEADTAVVIGFSMSDFDAMAQMQLMEVTLKREAEGRPLQVIVIDPNPPRDRFERIFRNVKFAKKKHNCFDWTRLPA